MCHPSESMLKYMYHLSKYEYWLCKEHIYIHDIAQFTFM